MKKLLFLSFIAIMASSLQAQTYIPRRNDSKMKIAPVIDLKAFAFNLQDVKLLEGSPFKNAMDKDAAYLLEIEPNRLYTGFTKMPTCQPKAMFTEAGKAMDCRVIPLVIIYQLSQCLMLLQAILNLKNGPIILSMNWKDAKRPEKPAMLVQYPEKIPYSAT